MNKKQIKDEKGNYTETFKDFIVEKVVSGSPKTHLAKKYGIRGHSTILNWCRRVDSVKGSTVERSSTETGNPTKKMIFSTIDGIISGLKELTRHISKI